MSRRGSRHFVSRAVVASARGCPMSKPFRGQILLDVRNSKPDWEAFLDKKAPHDAPNVLVILYDDTGQAAWSPYGGRIEMPTLDRLATEWPDVYAVAHDGCVLADALVLSHRTQSPPQRLRLDR